MSDQKPLVLLTGATGYVGGRLLPLLEQRGCHIRCMVRRPQYLTSRVAEGTEVVAGDAQNYDSLLSALQGVKVAYYLIHSMGDAGSFEEQDRNAAKSFAAAAREAGVQRIVYLGGLGDDDEDLSAHLQSRHEVGDLLRESGCQVVEFRASIVIGSGSLSFELVRSLVQRLPVMICPKWVSVQSQPIAIEDLLDYLMEALDREEEESRIFEIGGPEQVSYGEIMREYAKQRGLRRWFISVPILTPRLSSLWLGLVTPIYARVGRKLVDSLRNPTIVKDPQSAREFKVRPRGLSAAIDRALKNEDSDFAVTRWSDALSSSRGVMTWGGTRFGNRVVDSRCVTVAAKPEDAFRPIRRIGGKQGWYYANFLWAIRGWIDLACGGVGLRRGRRDQDDLQVGEVLDWWRVEEFIPNQRLRLGAEMKVPGRAWLEFEVEPCDEGSTIRQTAIFDPAGVLGLAYWYGIFPLHAVIFRGMLNRIGAAALHQAETPTRAESAQTAGSEQPETLIHSDG